MYSVMLTVTSTNGCTASVNMPNYITVYDVPVANFTSSVSGPTVTFTNTTTGGTPAYTFQWDFNDGSPLDFTVNPVHTFLIDGTYNVCLTVTDANNCSSTTCHTVVVFTTGIDKQVSAFEISIYPNPSLCGIFYLDLKENAMISIYDLVGKYIRTESVRAGKNTLDLHEFSQGTYFVKIENENGTIIKKISIGK